jgi:hypothetical protein
MREDPVKVGNYQVWLNGLTPGQTWNPLPGFNAITTCYYTPTGQLIYNPNLGTPLKAFINQATGEVRSFDARYFYA